MALPKLNVEIGAETSGFSQGMQRAIAASNDLNSKMKMTINSSGRLIDRFGQTVRVTSQMEKAMRDAGVDIEEVASAMNHMKHSTDSARDSLARVSKVSIAANDNLGRQVRGNNAFGRSVQNMSFQVGDFATQVGAGTSASVALGQQLPQLLGGFGILGAAMGAVVAIGVPLVRVLTDVQKGGKDLSPILGNLAPLARELGSALSAAKDIAVDFAETVINNMDRLLTTAGTVAAFFAGKWVAGIIIAKAATFSFVGALTALKWALVRTGFGIVIVAAGELVYQFSRLVTASGGFGKAFGIVISTAKVLFASLGPFMVQQLGLAVLKIADIFNGSNINKVIQEKFGIDVARELLATAKSAGDAFQEMAGPDKIGAANAAIEKMDALLSSVNSKHISLGDIFGGGKQDGEAANSNDPNAKDDGFAAKLDRLRESLMTERDLIIAAEAEKLGIIEEARMRNLMGEQEKADALAKIHQETNARLAAIDNANRDAAISTAASTFGALQSMAMAFGKKGAKIAQVFGLAKALISTFTGAAKALELPFPANIAAFAQVMATGMGAVASIKGVNTTGGGNSAVGSGGSAPAAAAPRPLDVMIQGLQPNDLISGGQLSSLFDKLIDEAGDRGIRPMFAA
jgi:hypothetical protein